MFLRTTAWSMAWNSYVPPSCAILTGESANRFAHIGALLGAQGEFHSVRMLRAQLDPVEFSLGAILNDSLDIPGLAML